MSGPSDPVLGSESEELRTARAALEELMAERERLLELVVRLPGLLAEHDPEQLVAGVAEALPFRDGKFHAVVCAQAFHWFDFDKALPEIARVLKTRGRLSLVWNERDERIPWVRRLGAIIGTQEQLNDPTEVLERSSLFGEVERATYRHRQVVDRDSIQDLVRSRSNIATLGEADRAARLRQVLELYDDYGRGMDGMQLPYVTRCFRARVRPPASADGGSVTVGPDEVDTDSLLIDFH